MSRAHLVAVPEAPAPDDKDWTWAIDRPCPDCCFDPATVDRHDIARLTLAYADAINVGVDHPGATQRPAPRVWSPAEYACHVRDVCMLFEQRLDLMLDEDDPRFDNWDQDAAALERRYWEVTPAAAADGLDAAAESIAARWAQVRDDQWQRPGRRSNGSVFTVETFGRYFLHDLAHHAWDVRG